MRIGRATLLIALALGATSACTTEECSSTPDCPGSQVCAEHRCVVRLEPPKPAHVDLTDGWDDPPGSGIAFIVDTLAIAEAGVGFNVDDQCRGPGDCIDNVLWQLGQLGNDQIRQGLLGGETLAMMEITGIDEPFYGDDAEVTVRWYAAKDADDPFFPANNFQIPVGETKCCEFLIHPKSLDSLGRQAKTRLHARIVGGRLDVSEPGRFEIGIVGGTSTTADNISGGFYWPINFERTQLTVRLASDESHLVDGLIGGAVSINSLSQLPNPYCETINQLCPQENPDAKMLDLVASILQPDADIDGETGLDRLERGPSGRISACLDEQGRFVRPMESSAPWTCALQPEMGDGYSIGITFAAVRATVVGIGH